MKPLIMFGIAYIAVPLSSVLGIQAPTTKEVEPATVEVVSEDPPLAVVEQTSAQPDPPTAQKSQKELNKEIVETYTIQYFGEEQVDAMNKIVMKESGFNNLAQNKHSTAFGMMQFLDSSWKGTGISKTTDPIQQAEAGCIYIRNRYGNPTEALNFHLSHGWY